MLEKKTKTRLAKNNLIRAHILKSRKKFGRSSVGREFINGFKQLVLKHITPENAGPTARRLIRYAQNANGHRNPEFYDKTIDWVRDILLDILDAATADKKKKLGKSNASREFINGFKQLVLKHITPENAGPTARRLIRYTQNANGHSDPDFADEAIDWVRDILLDILDAATADKIYNNGNKPNAVMITERNIYKPDREAVSEPLKNINLHIDQAFAEIVQELRENGRVSHPTKTEKVLAIIRSSGDAGFTIDALAPLFQDAANPARAAAVTLAKLNTKLAKKNLHIQRAPTYHVEFTETE